MHIFFIDSAMETLLVFPEVIRHETVRVVFFPLAVVSGVLRLAQLGQHVFGGLQAVLVERAVVIEAEVGMVRLPVHEMMGRQVPAVDGGVAGPGAVVGGLDGRFGEGFVDGSDVGVYIQGGTR